MSKSSAQTNSNSCASYIDSTMSPDWFDVVEQGCCAQLNTGFTCQSEGVSRGRWEWCCRAPASLSNQVIAGTVCWLVRIAVLCSHGNGVLLGKDVKVDGHDIMAIGNHLRCKKNHSLCVGGEIYVPRKTVGTKLAHCCSLLSQCNTKGYHSDIKKALGCAVSPQINIQWSMSWRRLPLIHKSMTQRRGPEATGGISIS